MELNKIYSGNCLDVLRNFPDESINTCVTSPPYWGLRDYGVPGQLGLESTPEEYVAHMVEVFREVRRVLRDDGTLWINLGDSFYGSWGNYGGMNRGNGKQRAIEAGSYERKEHLKFQKPDERPPTSYKHPTLKPKDLVGIPWRVAFALQADGWYLRSDIIWHKPNAMPESVRDRPTKAHEYIFLFAKSPKYYYDADAIKEPIAESSLQRINQKTFDRQTGGEKDYRNGTNPNRSMRKTLENFAKNPSGRNKRTVWTISTKPFKGAHFATFPPDLIEPCILAGCPEDGIILDPFFGAGTTGLVAMKNNRNYVGVELNPEYIEIANKRLEEAV